MLQVAREPKHYSERYKLWHLIRIKKWGGPNYSKLMTLNIQYFCEELPIDRTPSKTHPVEIEPYKKDIHSKKLCEDCIKAVKAYNNKGG